MLDVGLRVVRGPDWKWGNQDNGEGHVGTVVEVGKVSSTSSPDKTVVVQWDTGSRTNYRCGYQDAYDLRLFDNSPAGVRHHNVICDGCKNHGVSGMLWKCTTCFDFDLCQTCYMNDTHDLTHPFRRFDSPTAVGVDLQPRQDSPKIVSKGIFAGARVIRGPDWDWGNQDGGEGKVGRCLDIRGWDNESALSVANIIWSSSSVNVYRLGHKGKVDLKCVQASSAGSYYVNHLPILGMPTSTINSNSSSGTAKPVSNKGTFSFSVGDKVQVIQDIQKLKDGQEGHGGWNPRMAEFIGKIGVVHRVTDKGDIRVQYDSGIRWTFNPMAVTKIIAYAVGDQVQVIHDCNKVKEFQRGHGEWVDVMKEILGRTGTIVKVYGDNDLRINFGSSIWTMNPLTVKLVRHEANNSMYLNAHHREDSNPMTSVLPLLDDGPGDQTGLEALRLDDGTENPQLSNLSTVVEHGACANSNPLNKCIQPPTFSDLECVLCSEVTSLVLFEPCGHRVVCEECCVRMKKCVNCQLAIHRKLNQHGQTISSSSRNSLNTSAERLRYLENKFVEIEETYCCSICMERRRNVAFLCGHGACERCADSLTICHMCRNPIKQKINLY